MKKLPTLVALPLSLITVAAMASPASALDGPRIASGQTTARYYGADDSFRVCVNGVIGYAVLTWNTATLSGRHVVYDGCQRFDHAFVKGTRVYYKLCHEGFPMSGGCATASYAGVSES